MSALSDIAVTPPRGERLPVAPALSLIAGRTGDDAAEQLLEQIHALAPSIAARADEIRIGRRIPQDLVMALRSIGVFRMFTPRSHGGPELDLPGCARIIETLSRIDGSLGWCAAISSGSAMFASLLPRDRYDKMFGEGRDVIFAGSGEPGGTAEAEAVDGAWRVSGRWAFASGCQHADWIVGTCVMKRDGEPLPGQLPGMPMMKLCMLPASRWRIEDTWHVAGLEGTGSHHFAIENAMVTDEDFVDMFAGKPCIPGPLYNAMPQVVPVLHAAVHVGIAEGALRALVDQANTGWQQRRVNKPARETDLFKYELGRISADLRAARALYRAQAESHWQHALAGTLKDEALLAEACQTAAWVTRTCNQVAEACFTLGGAAAIYQTSPLQQRMRDLLVASQHYMVQQRHYLEAGARLLGNPGAAARTGS